MLSTVPLAIMMANGGGGDMLRLLRVLCDMLDRNG